MSLLHGDNSDSRLFVLRESSKVNVSVLYQISKLLHNIASYNRDIISIREELNRIKNEKPIYPVPITIILTGVACLAFGWINHGDPQSLWVIWISSVLALTMKYKFGSGLNNLYLSTLMTALVGGLCAALLIPLSDTSTPEVALISSILFLITRCHNNKWWSEHNQGSYQLRNSPSYFSINSNLDHSWNSAHPDWCDAFSLSPSPLIRRDTFYNPYHKHSSWISGPWVCNPL